MCNISKQRCIGCEVVDLRERAPTQVSSQNLTAGLSGVSGALEVTLVVARFEAAREALGAEALLRAPGRVCL